MNGLKPDGSPSLYIYVNSNDPDSQTAFTVISQKLASGQDIPSMAKLEAKIRRQATAAEESGTLSDFTVESVRVKGAKPSGIVVYGTMETPQGEMMMRTLTLVTPHRGYVIMAMSNQEIGVTTQAGWDALVRSMEFETDKSFFPMWAYFVLGGALLLLALKLFSSKKSHNVYRPSGEFAGSPMNTGTRAMDGLDNTFGSGGRTLPGATSRPSPGGGLTSPLNRPSPGGGLTSPLNRPSPGGGLTSPLSRPVISSKPKPAPPGLKRTLPRAGE